VNIDIIVKEIICLLGGGCGLWWLFVVGGGGGGGGGVLLRIKRWMPVGIGFVTASQRFFVLICLPFLISNKHIKIFFHFEFYIT